MVTTYAERYKATQHSPIEILMDRAAACLLDGGANLGAYVSKTAMDIAMRKSGEFGIGVVVVKNSNHFGPAGHYVRQAAMRGFIGFCATTALVDLAPWGGLTPVAGKNPFAISFPGDKFPIVLDVACSVAARQKVIGRAREGIPIPEGWALDKDGNPTTDAASALDGIFLPMGGHKGIGIALMIEYLVAALGRGGYSHNITKEKAQDPTAITNIGHIFAAIDPTFFLTPEERVQETARFSNVFHSGRAAPGVKKLYLPGELEWDTFRERSASGIPIAESIIRQVNEYADKIGIPHVCEI
jgi:LDH2 family malate/lactate/ureidoglycolate dehydrogenase